MSIAISGLGNSAMTQAMSGASMRMPPAQKMAKVFDQIDTSGSGTVTKSQFEQAFQNLKMPQAFKTMGADAIFSKLDPNGTGSVSKQDFVNGMKSLISQVRSHHQNASASSAQSTSQAGPSPAQTLASSLDSLNSLGKQSSSTIGTMVNTTA